jgi:hypothetical protein
VMLPWKSTTNRDNDGARIFNALAMFLSFLFYCRP